MHCFINLCRCCLSSDIPLTKIKNEYFCKREGDDFNTTNYFNLILDIYPDLQLKRTLPCILCNDCQRLLQEATKMKHYLDFQMEDKQSQKLLMEESVCSGCTQFCSSLFDTIDVNNSLDVHIKSSIIVLKEAFPYYQFQSQISYKYCESCNNNVKSVYLLKEKLSVNNDLYEKYCSTLIGSSEHVIFSTLLIVPETKAVDCNNSTTETDVVIKEEVSTGIELIEIKVENYYYDDSNNLSNDTEGDYEIEQQQIYIKVESSNTRKEPYQCDICSKVFMDNSHLTTHKRIHTGEKPYKCNVCLKAFSTNGNLKIHEQIHTGIKTHKCDICSSTFSSSSNLTRHKHAHTGEKVYKCDFCPKVFFESSSLKIHNRIHTGEKPYQCNICMKTFSSSSNLKKHEQFHTGEKAYECNICSNTFASSSNLKKHVRIHTGEKPYICNMCTKAFSESNSLKIHERIHTGERPYKCNTCEKAFISSGNLRTHERVHTGEKPYKCNMCPKAFAGNGDLKMHMQTHTGERPHECNICLRAFSSSSYLKKHKLTHNVEKPL